MLEDLEIEKAEFESVREFLFGLRKEFVGGDKEAVKVAELKRVEK